MTELEEKFYKVMGIEPITQTKTCKILKEYWENEEIANQYCFLEYMEKKCPHYQQGCTENCEHISDSIIYPPITDHILLELVCILNKNFYISQNIDELKNEVLIDCIKYADDIKDDVRKLFEE